MDILNRQRKMQEEARIAREEAAKKKAQLIAANPKPPRFPAGPLQSVDPEKGIFGIRTVKRAGRKLKHKKTRKNNGKRLVRRKS